jgi:hypothetical protein
MREHAARADAARRREVIRSRLAAHLPLHTLTPYRPPRSAPAPGTPTGDEPTSAPVAASQCPSRPPQRSEDTVDDGQDDLADAEPEASKPLVDLPDVAWISTRDGTRAPGDPPATTRAATS